MKETTMKLLEKVDREHDWISGDRITRQIYYRRITYHSKIDVCRICGLQRQWVDDIQHGIYSEYSFADEYGRPLTLREAAARKCLSESE
jgi:hypothetical protein